MVDAVVDRIVDGKHLVLLVGEDEKEEIVALCSVTEHLKEGDWVTLSVHNDGTLSDIVLHTEKTIEKQESIEEKMKRLRAKKGNGSRFQT